IVIVGNGVVGKSSMIQRFCRGIFSNEYKKTLGVDFMERMIRVKSENIRLMLWDTAGQEEFDAITKAYYRDRQSFLSIEKWKKKVEFECGDIPMAIVHNKIDLSHQSVVRREEVDSLVKRHHWKLFRTSVKDNLNVENVFHFLAESYINSINDDYNEEPVFHSSNQPFYTNNMPNIMQSNTDPLFHQRIAPFVPQYRQQRSQTYKLGYNYLNSGMGLQTYGSNGVVSHYRYNGLPMRRQSSAIVLHRPQSQYQQLLAKHSLNN
ncbi:unnamed protein product, partial [Medioppia subpectinata]